MTKIKSVIRSHFKDRFSPRIERPRLLCFGIGVQSNQSKINPIVLSVGTTTTFCARLGDPSAELGDTWTVGNRSKVKTKSTALGRWWDRGGGCS